MAENIDPTLDATALEIKHLAEQAQAELDAALSVGPVTPSVVQAIQNRFNAAYVQVLAKSMGIASGNPFDVRMVGDMPISGLRLADKLYNNARQTANEVVGLIAEHTKGQMQARELAMRLYDGYNPKDGIVRPLEGAARAKLPKALQWLTANPTDRAALQQVFEQGQHYAATLKTEPLKAAYLQALKTWEKGKGEVPLKRALDIAHKEKTRYMANRIAQTEISRAHQDAVAREFMGDDSIEVVQIVMSAAHPRMDICDLHSHADLHGLGPGRYPKAKAPKPPFHPFCRCKLRSRPDLFSSMVRETPNAEAAYLRTLGPVDGSRVMGSRERLQLVLNGGKLDDVVNQAKDPYYKLVRLGGAIKTTAPNAMATSTPPGIMQAMTTFQEQKSVKAAAKWAVDNNLADFADYTGIKPEVANAWNRSLFDHLQEFPELRANQKFVGTCQGQNDRAVDVMTARMRAANPSFPTNYDFSKIAKKLAGVVPVKDKYAHSWQQPDVFGIAVNRKYGADVDIFTKSLKYDLSQKFHPVGCDSIRSVVDHEMGHQIDALLGLRVDSEVIKLYNDCKAKGMKDEVSGYADKYIGEKGIGEFIAECWGEVCNNSTPRPYARAIGNIVRARYRSKFGSTVP